jgi:hypothetical protein
LNTPGLLLVITVISRGLRCQQYGQAAQREGCQGFSHAG